MESNIADKEQKVRQETFHWLLERLLPSHTDKFKGCELIFPETVLFNKGKPTMLLKSDKEFCLVAIKSSKGQSESKSNKLSNENIYKYFSGILRDRK